VKKLIPFCCLFLCLHLAAQDALTYPQLLANNEEIHVSDSLFITSLSQKMNKLDSTAVKKWFYQVLSISQTGKLKNRDFFLAGKMTGNPQFDLHVLVEDKKNKKDSFSVQVIHLVTTHKDGAYISSFKAAVTGAKKKSSYNISSWIYKDLNIVQNSRITTSTASMADIAQYKITSSGRFMMYSN
jgi:hypothetical protein